MKTFRESFAECTADEGVYSLLLTGGEAPSVLRLLQTAASHDVSMVAERLQRLLVQQHDARLDGGGETGACSVWHDGLTRRR